MATGRRRWWWLLAGAAIAGGVTAAWLGLQSPTGQHDWDPPFAPEARMLRGRKYEPIFICATEDIFSRPTCGII